MIKIKRYWCKIVDLTATLSLWEFLILCLGFMAILKAAHDAKVGKKELKKLRQYLDSQENRQWLSRDTTSKKT